MTLLKNICDRKNPLNEKKLFSPVKTDSIEFIHSKNDISTLFFTDRKEIDIRKSLNDWEKILPFNNFLRISRSVIINLEHVKKIEKSNNQTLIIYMNSNTEPLIMTRSYTRKLKGKFII